MQHNRRISINYYQSFSTKAGRTVTKYVLSEYVGSDDGERGKFRNLFSSWSLPDVVKYLAGILQGETVPEDTRDAQGG